MKHAGPPLEMLLHRLTQCPPEMHEHCGASAQRTLALVCDYFRQHDPQFDAKRLAQAWPKLSVKHCSVTAIVIWLLHDPWFLARHPLVPQMQQLLTDSRLLALSEMGPAALLVSDPDRREELVRLTLAALDLRPAGETLAQATDRFNTLDSVERKRILAATLAAEKRAREVREAMARARAQESASRYGE